jgi:hypothetical protein
MQNNISISEYDEKYRNSCIELLEKTFPNESNERTFTWRFEKCKIGKPIIVIAKLDDSVVSFNSWIPWKFKYANKVFTGYQSGESATDKRFRGRGIWSAVLKYIEPIAQYRQADFLFGFPSNMSYRAFFKAGYHSIITNYFRINILDPLLIFKKQRVFKTNNVTSISIQDPDKITPVTDMNYEQWRYTENTKEYSVLEYCENSCLAKFIIRKRVWRGVPETILVDCNFNSFSELFCDRAFNYLEHSCSKNSLYIRTFFNEHTSKGRVLNKYFKWRIRKKYHVLAVKQISERIPSVVLYNGFNWDLMPHLIDEY